MLLSRWTAPLVRWLRPTAPVAPSADAPAPPPPEPPAAHLHPSGNDTAVAAATPADVPLPEAARTDFIAWLLGADTSGRPGSVGGDASGEALIRHLDTVIASEPLRANLLPRAPQVVPQLMKLLRDEHYSSAEVAQRASKDAVLAAEIVRLANSAAGRPTEPAAAGEAVADLRHAVDAIGTSGLRRAIAKVLLRPIFEVRGDSLSAHAAPQIWKDADAKAQLCGVLAGSAGLDPLDGYLAGLLHNTGWSAALRALDAMQPRPSIANLPLTAAFTESLLRRRDTLFGLLVREWDVSDTLVALVDEVAAVGLDAVTSPLGVRLRFADRLAARHALQRRGRLGDEAAAPLNELTGPVKACYAGLAASG